MRDSRARAATRAARSRTPRARRSPRDPCGASSRAAGSPRRGRVTWAGRPRAADSAATGRRARRRRPACWACVTSGNSTGAASTAPVAAAPRGRIAGAPAPSVTSATGNSCTPSAPTRRVSRGVREARPQARAQAGRVRQRERLGEHRAGVPVDVPEAALGVAPAGAPRHAGDDQRRGLAVRGRRDPDQRMLDRVVPVHAVGHAFDAAGRHVELQREAPAGRTGRAQQQRRPVRRARRRAPRRRRGGAGGPAGRCRAARAPRRTGPRARRSPRSGPPARSVAARLGAARRRTAWPERARWRSRSGPGPAPRVGRRAGRSIRARGSTRSGGGRGRQPPSGLMVGGPPVPVRCPRAEVCRSIGASRRLSVWAAVR